MVQEEMLRKIEGLQTVESVMGTLEIKRQSAVNLLSRLKKQGYITTMGGGKKIRLYKITQTKQRKRDRGMFDILNKYNQNFQLREWYDHQVHGKYTVEDAIVDAIETGSFRAILATLRLFNHITDWPRLYRLAKEKNSWQKVGALHDVSRAHYKARRIPSKYANIKGAYEWQQLTQLKNRNNFPDIQKKWHVYIPFNEKDILSAR